jgi:hypothetical protein
MKVEFIFKDAWNTGRQYSEHGQRIAVYEAVADGEAKALFMLDLDRHLDYFYDLPYSPVELRSHVMTRYDHNEALTTVWGTQWYQAIQDPVCNLRRDALQREFPAWRS